MGCILTLSLSWGGKRFLNRQKVNASTAMEKNLKPIDLNSLPPLAAIAPAVVTEYRELGRQELVRRRQPLADQTGEVFPPAPTAAAVTHAAHRTRRRHPDHGLRPGSADA